MKFSESLKKNKDFQTVYQKRKVLMRTDTLVMYIRREWNFGRTDWVFPVSKKVGNSVVRHHLTRLIRESYRLQEEHFQCGYDIVIIAQGQRQRNSISRN